MSQHLENLTKNNDHPSDKALLEVKELLSGPRKQLEETNADIERLEGLIQGLKEKRTEIEQTINRYSCILSPIRRVPPDILHAIFAHCLPTHRNPTMGASESPMLLTRICSIWRSTALASPRLWAQIHIPFRTEGDAYSGYVGYPPIPSEKVSDILRLRCRAVREWLSRSGDCPLSISITYARDLQFPRTEWSDRSTTLLLETILSYSPRWQNLELCTPLEAYCELENILSTNTLSKLVQLRVSIYGQASDSYPVEPSLSLLESPNLQRISTRLLFCKSLPQVMLVPWHNITHLADHSTFTIQEFIILLKCCPRLIHGDFTISAEHFETSSEIISLPYLNSLWITERLQVSSMWNNLYDFIYAPQLRWIEYRNHGPLPLTDQHGPDDSSASSIGPLIARTTELQTLAIERFRLSPYRIVKILQMAPPDYLTKLVLNSNDFGYVGSHIPDPFDLVLLVVNDHPVDPTTPMKVLLPRLEVFELRSTLESDVTVMRFITSRMTKLSHVAVLRKVKIVFNRTKEQNGIDIAEEVRAQAVRVGIHIDLNLQYLPSLAQVPGYVDPLSPSFIANTGYDGVATDRTWEFRDLMDEDSDTQISS